MAKVKCPRGKHRDKPLRGGRRVRCEVCGDEYPCGGECQHLDCRAAREDPEFLRATSEWGDIS